MQKQTFKNSYTKLYLVPPDIYHTIIKSLPNKTDISNIQNLNETDTMPPQHPSADKDESESHSNQNDISTVENDILQAAPRAGKKNQQENRIQNIFISR